MYDLSTFALNEAILAGAALRQIGKGAGSLERAAQHAVRYFYEHFVEVPGGRSAFALVRAYLTQPLASLPPDLAGFARGLVPGVALAGDTACLALLATYGDAPQWQARTQSEGHQAIPLVSVESVAGLPMVARLTDALGLRARDMVHPDPAFLLERDRAGFNVFHVERAEGSPHIPAQDFVRDAKIRSVVGFGFVIPPSHVFTAILFARQAIPYARAELFKTLALSLKLAFLPLVTRPVFG